MKLSSFSLIALAATFSGTLVGAQTVGKKGKGVVACSCEDNADMIAMLVTRIEQLEECSAQLLSDGGNIAVGNGMANNVNIVAGSNVNIGNDLTTDVNIRPSNNVLISPDVTAIVGNGRTNDVQITPDARVLIGNTGTDQVLVGAGGFPASGCGGTCLP
ncbi:MAG: hypothetical protein SGARI_006737 [Bacillariaceae sp.]